MLTDLYHFLCILQQKMKERVPNGYPVLSLYEGKVKMAV